MTAARRSLRLVHTSDVHLGYLPTAALARRSFVAVVDAALDVEAHGLLIVGDVFESNHVPDTELDFLISELARFGRPSLVLPGNHDSYDAASVYRRSAFRQRPSFIHVVDEAFVQTQPLRELGLEVWGQPVVHHWRDFRPLVGVPSSHSPHWRVAMAHGHYEEPGDSQQRSSPIFPEDIAAARCDYVALGHWDRSLDVSHGGVTAFYSGAPTRPDRPGELAHVLVVDLVPGRAVNVRPCPLVERTAAVAVAVPHRAPVRPWPFPHFSNTRSRRGFS